MSVEAWEDQIQIDTYVLGPENPYPPLHRTGMGAVYPYPLLDDMPGPRRAETYRALHLENEYLRATVLPQLGGHLYSLYDKLRGCEVFYRNNVVKYGFVARRGAWISGGVEFNFPQGHTCVTVSPVMSRLIQSDEDGGARIAFGATDRLSRMRWCVELRLVPGEARLRQRVVLHNPMPYRQRHYFWSNSAVPATDDLHLVLPATRVRTSHGDHEYPVLDGRDLSWYRNHEIANDIFCLDSAEDFFGCYYENSDRGLVHWSDHRIHFGKKFFTWGTADDGMIWVDLLTDDDGQYVELQSGRFVDQATFDFLGAHENVEWEELWYPVSGIGGYQYANQHVAVNCSVVADRLSIAGVAAHEIGRTQLSVERDGGSLDAAEVNLMPGEPFSAEVALPGGADAPVVTLCRDGRELLRFSPGVINARMRPIELAAGPRNSPEQPHTPDELACAGVRAELRNDLMAAQDRYRQALSADEGHAGAHLGLGLIALRRGLFDEAREHLQAATKRDRHDDEAWFTLALTELAAGNEPTAEQLLWWLTQRTPFAGRARIELAKLALRRENPTEALELVAHCQGGLDAVFIMTVACRMLELQDEHHKLMQLGTTLFPLAPEMAVEAFLSVLDETDIDAVSGPLALLLNTIRDDAFEWLELALRYSECGAPSVALLLLGLACDSFDTVAADPIIRFHMGSLLTDRDDAAEVQAGLAADPEYCFPSRVETLAVLDEIIDRGPVHYRAHLYRGNLLAFLHRHDEALAAWEAAADLWRDDPVLCRNLGLGCSLWRDDHAAARGWYDRAVEIAPADYRLYLERDDALRRAEAAAATRLEYLSSAPPAVTSRWEIAGRTVDCLVELQRWDAAIELLSAHSFLPWEGARGVHDQWVRAHVGRAGERLERGEVLDAIADYETALTYPRNLGVGRRACPEEARVHWLLAAAAVAAGDEEKRIRHLTAGAEERHHRPCEADIDKVRCLRALGRDEEAEQVLGRLREFVAERLRTQPEDQSALAIQRALEQAPGG